MENVVSRAVSEGSVQLLNLPVELLVYITSFLPAIRDRMKLRYVSRRLRTVSETPSLWSEFVWPLYDRREERSVMSVLKRCGEYIKRMFFPDHVTPSILIKMLNHCNNVTELRLPPGAKLSCKQLAFLQSMKQLEKLEALLSNDFKLLLQISTLRELTLHAEEKAVQPFCMPCVEEWVTKGFVPCNLNVVVHTYNLNIVEHEFATQLRKNFSESWRQWNSTIPVGHTAWLKLYNNVRSPLNVSPIFPTIQLEFNKTANLPFAKASEFGMLGLDTDLLLLTDSIYNNKTTFKAEIVAPDEFSPVPNDGLTSTVVSLSSVTDFNLSRCRHLHSGHLEQLAMACPNIRRLNLGGNIQCLRALQGLRAITLHCQHLIGINLVGISLEHIENHIRLWEILSEVKKLRYLSIGVCLFGVGLSTDLLYVHNCCNLFWKFSNLEGIEFCLCWGTCWGCLSCEAEIRWVWVFLSSFRSLKHCIFDCDDSDSVQSILTSCEEVQYLHCHCYENLSLSSVYNSNLRELSIVSHETDVPDIFLETVSAHGGLIHVALAVNSATIEGLSSVIEHSPKLLTFVVYTYKSIGNAQCMKVNLTKFKSEMKRKYFRRKIFSVGKYEVVQKDEGSRYSFIEDYVPGTNLASLWVYI